MFFVRIFFSTLKRVAMARVSKVNDLYLFHDINLARLKLWNCKSSGI